MFLRSPPAFASVRPIIAAATARRQKDSPPACPRLRSAPAGAQSHLYTSLSSSCFDYRATACVLFFTVCLEPCSSVVAILGTEYQVPQPQNASCGPFCGRLWPSLPGVARLLAWAGFSGRTPSAQPCSPFPNGGVSGTATSGATQDIGQVIPSISLRPTIALSSFVFLRLLEAAAIG